MSAGMPIPTGSGQKDPRRAAAILNGQPNPRRPSYLYKGPAILNQRTCEKRADDAF